MFLNNFSRKINGIKNRIVINFSIIFIFIISLSTLTTLTIFTRQNKSILETQFSEKSKDIDIYFQKIILFIENYNEKKITLKFEPTIKNQTVVYSKPFNPGDENFKYIVHIKNNKNNLDDIVLNTVGSNISNRVLKRKLTKELISNNIIPTYIKLNESLKNRNYAAIRMTREIKGATFDIYIMKDVQEIYIIAKNLKIVFLITLLLGLALIVLTAKVISNRILKPIKNIIKTSKEITNCQDLSTRIENTATDDELIDLTNIINEMLDTIYQTFEKQSRFISDVSHELRTPISILKGYADLINRRYISKLTEEEKQLPKNQLLLESISSILKESENMGNLVNSLLFLSKVDKKEKVQINEVELNSVDILEQIKNDYDIVMKNKIQISKKDNFNFSCDKNLMLQALRIIVENAIKYSDDKEKVYISSILDEKKKIGYICVKDKGIGIDRINIEKIFDRFYRVDESRNKNTGGYGLGLSIFKRIIEIQNQEYMVKSKIGVGTEITIIIKNIKI